MSDTWKSLADEADVERLQALQDIAATYSKPDPATLSKLPKPYSKDSAKSHCDVCGGYHGLPAAHLDYMGHADVTLALLAIDPDWDWAPAMINEQTGGPVITKEGGRLVMWGTLTVLGKTRRGVGTCEAGKGDPEKELIGDLLRNIAMRFGIGTSLWSKALDADPFGSGASGGYERAQGRQRRDEPTGQAGTARRSTAQGRPNQRQSAPPSASYVDALATHLGKTPSYVLAVARPVAKGYGLEQPTAPGMISPELCATVAVKLNVDPTDIGLGDVRQLSHDKPADAGIEGSRDVPHAPAYGDAPGWSEAYREPEPHAEPDVEPGLHEEWCTGLHRPGEPCDEEPF